MNAEKIICNYMASFFKEYFEEIKYDLSDSSLPTEKKKFVNLIKTDVQVAIWSMFELCSWGMNKKYLRELLVEIEDSCEFSIIRIGNKYIKIILDKSTYKWSVKFAKPKTKKVIYFD